MAETASKEPRTAQWLVAAGGLLGASAAASCCILPLALFGLGVGGAWIGNLSALAPYQPAFAAVTVALLGYGHYLVHRKREPCAAGETCARPLSNRLVKVTLWSATALVAAALVFPYVAPVMLGI